METSKIYEDRKLRSEMIRAWRKLPSGHCQLFTLNGSLKPMFSSCPIVGLGQNVITDADTYRFASENNSMFVLRKPNRPQDIIGERNDSGWYFLKTSKGSIIITREAPRKQEDCQK